MDASVSDELLQRAIPYRLDAVATMNLAARLLLDWGQGKTMQIFFDGDLTIEGTSSGLFNPVIEAGLVHCRALLEFVGLKADPANPAKLTCRTTKRADDFGIEEFHNSSGPLPLVTPEAAIGRYPGGCEDAESALALVLSGTNKLVAHITRGTALPDDRLRLVEIASRGVHAIVVSHLYTPLGLAPPKLHIAARKRDAA
jgi:hypothetical protein